MVLLIALEDEIDTTEFTKELCANKIFCKDIYYKGKNGKSLKFCYISLEENRVALNTFKDIWDNCGFKNNKFKNIRVIYNNSYSYIVKGKAHKDLGNDLIELAEHINTHLFEDNIGNIDELLLF